MATTISVRLDKHLLRSLSKVENKWKTDRSEVIRRLLAEALDSWKVKDALERLKEHKVSIGKAAEDTGLHLWEMMDLARENKIDWTGYSREDLERDLKLIE